MKKDHYGHFYSMTSFASLVIVKSSFQDSYKADLMISLGTNTDENFSNGPSLIWSWRLLVNLKCQSMQFPSIRTTDEQLRLQLSFSQSYFSSYYHCKVNQR